jgi:Fe-S-cluster containining protein
MSLINTLYSTELLSKIDQEYHEFDEPTQRQAQKIENELYRKLKGKTTIKRDDLKRFIHYALIIEGENEWKQIFQWNNYGGEMFCRSCGKCCKHMKIHLTEEDHQRLITHHIPTHHIEKIENNKYTFRETPCPHHNPQNRKCRIYKIRPYSCRNYPIINSPDGSRPILDRFSGCGYIINYLRWKVQRMIQKCR